MENLPFKIEILPGSPAYEQVIGAVHRAIASGLISEGDSFPSVRVLSKAAQINPNTAHKVVQALVQEGTLEVLPGRGTRIAPPQKRSAAERHAMLEQSMQNLIIEAKRVGFSKNELKKAIQATWETLIESKKSNEE